MSLGVSGTPRRVSGSDGRGVARRAMVPVATRRFSRTRAPCPRPSRPDVRLEARLRGRVRDGSGGGGANLRRRRASAMRRVGVSRARRETPWRRRATRKRGRVGGGARGGGGGYRLGTVSGTVSGAVSGAVGEDAAPTLERAGSFGDVRGRTTRAIGFETHAGTRRTPSPRWTRRLVARASARAATREGYTRR